MRRLLPFVALLLITGCPRNTTPDAGTGGGSGGGSTATGGGSGGSTGGGTGGATGGGTGGATGGGTGGATGGGTGGGATGGGAAGGGTGGGSSAGNGTCATPFELQFTNLADGGTTAQFNVDTAPAMDNATGSCVQGAGGRDVVYHFNLTSPKLLTAISVPTGTADGGVGDVAMYLRGTACTAATDLSCSDDGFDGDPEGLLGVRLTAGDYWLFLDNYDATANSTQAVSVSLDTPPAVPGNDTCTAPLALAFVSNVATVMGDTTSATNNNALTDGGVATVPTCSPSAASTGRDVVYSFTVPVNKTVSVVVTPGATSALTPAVYVMAPGQCSSDLSTDQLSCGSATTFAPLVLTNPPAGTYFLVVDSRNGTSGAFTLVATMSDFIAVTNDTCSTAQALGFDGGVTADTTNANNSNGPDGGIFASPSCSTSAVSSGKDIIYALAVGASQTVSIDVRPQTVNYEPVVYLRSTCGSDLGPDEKACDSRAGIGGTAHLDLINAPAGTYYLWVDGANGTSGPFTVTATTTTYVPPPANDLCTGAIAVLSGGSTQTVTGDTRTATNSGAGGCANSDSRDLFYSFTLSAAGRFTARATPTQADGGFMPSIWVRDLSACPADGGSVPAGAANGCINAPFAGGAADLIITSLDAGAYLLAVDGVNGTSGAFSMDLASGTTFTPVASDTCTSPTALTFTGGVARSNDTLRGAANDHPPSGSCIGAGPDRVYTFTTPATSTLPGGTVNAKAITWTQNAVEGRPSVYIQRACVGDAGVIVGCEANSTADLWQAAANGWGLSTNTAYFVWVDSSGGPGTPYALQVSLASAPPANDACGGAIALPLNTSVAGTTLGAKNDFQGTVAGDGGFYTGGAACGNQLPGADVVYSFTTALAGPYTVRLQPERGFDPGLAVTRLCAAGQCVDTVQAGNVNDAEQVTFTALAATTYFVIVDAPADLARDSASRGGFTLGVSGP